jgi:hypothetical protein
MVAATAWREWKMSGITELEKHVERVRACCMGDAERSLQRILDELDYRPSAAMVLELNRLLAEAESLCRVAVRYMEMDVDTEALRVAVKRWREEGRMEDDL